MVNGVQFKVCGLTRLEDAQAAADAGADYLGFIFYAASPRCVGLQRFAALLPDLPAVPKVAVTVSPTPDDAQGFIDAGFDRVQIHYPMERREEARKWSRMIGRDRLWLAPKMAPGAPVEGELEAWMELAGGVLWDGYKADPAVYGGTGKRSDWAAFAEARRRHPQFHWILAGGLGPDDAAAALDATGAEILDFNSGLELRPGVKDPKRILEVRRALETRR